MDYECIGEIIIEDCIDTEELKLEVVDLIEPVEIIEGEWFECIVIPL